MTTKVGPMVATLMRARGLTIGQLADEVGIHRNRLGDKIAGRMAFREEDILAVAEALGVKPGQLFDDPLELLGVTPTSGSSSVCTRTLSVVGSDLAWAA